MASQFQRMIANPALVQRLNWVMGSGFECMMCNGFLFGKGSSGHSLHSPATPAKVTNHYRQQNGRVYAEYLNVAWQLRDVTPADGGFVCVPGSHQNRLSHARRHPHLRKRNGAGQTHSHEGGRRAAVPRVGAGARSVSVDGENRIGG